MNRGRLLCVTAPAMRPKLGLFTSATGPLKNWGVLAAFRKSQRTSTLYRSPILLFLISEASRFRIGGRRIEESREDQVWSWNGCRMVHTGCSPERQPRVVPFGSSVQVLNQRSSVRFERRGLTPVGTALKGAGKAIGIPS